MQIATARRVRSVLGAILAALVVVACGPRLTIDAPPPQAESGVVPPDLPPLPPSVVDAPISYDLSATLIALEQVIPERFGDLDKRIVNRGNRRQSFAFDATRTPFAISLEDERLTISSVVSYAGRGWYNPPLLPEVSASCGTDGERPRLRIRIQSDLALTTDWALRTKTRLQQVAAYTDTDRDACRVTAFDFDVTDRVVDALRGKLRSELPKIDRRLAAFDVQSRLVKWYNEMHKPIRVADSLWLLLRPGIVHFGGLSATDSALVADIRLFASPTIVSGMEPMRRVTPLPPLVQSDGTVGDSARMLLEAAVGYDVASAMLAKQLVGRTFRKWNRRVRVEAARLAPVGDGRVALGLRFSGALEGEGWLVGTPVLDRDAELLTVPDLDFDVATTDLLVQGLSFLMEAGVVTVLREQARLPLAEPIAALRDKVEGAINRELTDGVSLVGSLVAGRLLDVVARSDALIVRAEASGQLALDIDREIEVKGRVGN